MVLADEEVIAVKNDAAVDLVAKVPVWSNGKFVVYDAQQKLPSPDGSSTLVMTRVLVGCRSGSEAMLAVAAGDLTTDRVRLDSPEAQIVPATVNRHTGPRKSGKDDVIWQWCLRPPVGKPFDVPVSIGGENGSVIIYVRPDTIRERNSAVEVWLTWLPANNATQTPNSSYAKQRMAIKCAESSIALLDHVRYSPNGTVLTSKHSEAAEFDAIIPDSVGETISDFVCNI